uniref:IS66 family transposase zinc-finger binding domain-containing protein n=1 Tax=Pseudomonas sp. CFBP 13710 TaxID=2775311 RepID=UPI00237A56DA|nr:IS66 family transposase zinc-finger binding domain-containing protein [Pseudomonas sp. CFBP 13710]
MIQLRKTWPRLSDGAFDTSRAFSSEPAGGSSETGVEAVAAPVKRRGKRTPLPAGMPRVEIVHELPEHERTCACGTCKQVIGEETSEQLEIIPMQVRVIRHIRKTYACKACETAPVTADKPAQLIEKSLASPSVQAMLLTTKYADGIPLYRFEKMLSRDGIPDPGALDDPVWRAATALSQPHARAVAGLPGAALRRTPALGIA